MVWIIISCVLFALAFWFIYVNQLLAPAFSYMGLLALSLADNKLGQPYLPINNTILISWLYACMILGTAAGCFFGYLIFTNTPRGAAVNFSSGHFFQYLLAKGFPIALAVMMMGIVLVLLLAVNNLN